MDKMTIRGGERLIGEVKISGAKNAALPLICAAMLAPGKSRLTNVPMLKDVETIKKLLSVLGVKISGNDPLDIDATSITNSEAPYDLVRKMRASVLVLGPLVARNGRARVSMPGGCAIGARPVNLHLKGLEALGCEIELVHGYIEARAKKLHGANIVLDLATVTGTENIMMAAALAEGETIIENAAKEPEVIAVADYLNKMGAKISGAGTDIITISGVKELTPSEFRIIPDRIEAGTFMVAAAMTAGDVRLLGCEPSHLDAVIYKIKEAGAEVTVDGDTIRVKGRRDIRSTDVKTLPYPGFPTDMQAQFMAMMCVGNGTSVISETVFENRFMHVSELKRMGSDIRIKAGNAIVKGVPFLSGAQVMATDLRASASLVLAGLAATGQTDILRIYHLDRGYEKMEKKFAQLGANIKRMPA